MTDWSDAEAWLERLKSQHRSSPDGSTWHLFWEWLHQNAATATRRPPMPMILAASSESAESKHQRLCEQLRWAHDHGIMADALRWLDECPREEWSVCPPDRWKRSFYPTLDDAEDDDGAEPT
jgi:hypothetical protein